MTAFEDQIAFLKSVGIELKPDVTIDDLMNEGYDPDDVNEAYLSLLCALGNIEELSSDIWHFDTECIEGSGSYVSIARRMAALSDGLLPLENIEDEVDYDLEKASLSFVFHGQPYKWELEVENDWVDGTVFSRLV